MKKLDVKTALKVVVSCEIHEIINNRYQLVTVIDNGIVTGLCGTVLFLYDDELGEVWEMGLLD